MSSLGVEELRTMTEEMSAKFTRLSRDLVEGLEERDCWAGELDIKNRFVGALLRVQSLRVKKAVKDEGKVNPHYPHSLPFFPHSLPSFFPTTPHSLPLSSPLYIPHYPPLSPFFLPTILHSLPFLPHYPPLLHSLTVPALSATLPSS